MDPGDINPTNDIVEQGHQACPSDADSFVNTRSPTVTNSADAGPLYSVDLVSGSPLNEASFADVCPMNDANLAIIGADDTMPKSISPTVAGYKKT